MLFSSLENKTPTKTNPKPQTNPRENTSNPRLPNSALTKEGKRDKPPPNDNPKRKGHVSICHQNHYRLDWGGLLGTDHWHLVRASLRVLCMICLRHCRLPGQDTAPHRTASTTREEKRWEKKDWLWPIPTPLRVTDSFSGAANCLFWSQFLFCFVFCFALLCFVFCF